MQAEEVTTNPPSNQGTEACSMVVDYRTGQKIIDICYCVNGQMQGRVKLSPEHSAVCWSQLQNVRSLQEEQEILATWFSNYTNG